MLANKEIQKINKKNANIEYMILGEIDQFMFYEFKRSSPLFCYPMASCVFLNDLLKEVQLLIDEGSAILVDKKYEMSLFRKNLKNINYVKNIQNTEYVVIARENISIPSSIINKLEKP